MLTPEELNREINASAQAVIENPDIPRHSRGYQGRVRFKRVVPVIVVEGEDGLEYEAEPVELSTGGEDGRRELFYRERVLVGRQKETSLGDILGRVLPLAIKPGGRVSGIIDLIKGLFG